jgi:lysophospholipase L1-like esterase
MKLKAAFLDQTSARKRLEVRQSSDALNAAKKAAEDHRTPKPLGLPRVVLLATFVWFVASTAFAQTSNELAASLSAETNAVLAKLRWLSPTNSEFEINGLPWFKENGGSLSRLSVRSKDIFRKEVWSLAQCPSGGRIRFRTDSTTLAIRLEYGSPPNMANMHAFGQTGIDLYVNGSYMVSAVADKDAKNGKIYEPILFDFSKQPRAEREITLYLPLYKPVKVAGIGVDDGAKIMRAKKFAVTKPVVFYGTSITQGGCASRAGMSYQAILGRKLNLDFVNLGFSGNGLGEPELARAVAEIDASCYVLDFGANHKTFEAMREVYAPFLDYVRAQHPATPIVVMTLLHTSRENRIPSLGKEWPERRQFIEQLVRGRIKAGDKKLYLVDGAKLLGATPDDAFVDGGHPNDLGFYWMAEGLAPTMRKALKLR